MKKRQSKPLSKWLAEYKIYIEIIAIAIAVCAIYFPLNESKKTNELATNTLELTQEELKLERIPFLNFKVLKYFFTDFESTDFLLLEIENFSDVPAITLRLKIYIDGSPIPQSNDDYGDLMPRQKQEVKLRVDAEIKKRFFHEKSKLDIDLVTTDMLGIVYHIRRRISFKDGAIVQEESEFYCEEGTDCPNGISVGVNH